MTIHLIGLEGPRGGGKSEASKKLREWLPASTLINFTGFKDNGDFGKDKVFQYYNTWITLFESLAAAGHNYTFIWDRSFISEMVFSKLYKSYTFDDEGMSFLHRLLKLDVQIDLFNVTVNSEKLPNRLKREKTDDFSKFAESVTEIERQREVYADVFEKLREVKKESKMISSKIYFYDLDTSELTPSEVVSAIWKFI